MHLEMNYLWRTNSVVHNISCLKDLNRLDLSSCGSVVSIHERIPDHPLKKLKQIVSEKQLTELVLIDCFDEPEKLCEILKALQGNSNIKQLSLDLLYNTHNLDCAREICKLIRRKVLVSLALPEKLNESCTAEILYEITKTDLKLKLLDISESVLNEDAIKYLEEILKNRNVYNQLKMKKCEGVSETTLTTKDYEKLTDAEKRGRRLLSLNRKVHITWFNYVKHAESGDLNPNEWEMAEIEEVIPTFFEGKAGRFEKVVRLIARNKKGGPWQLLSGRKRRSDEPTRPPKVRKEEVDDLAELFGKHSVGATSCGANSQVISNTNFQSHYQLPDTVGSNIDMANSTNAFQSPIAMGLAAQADHGRMRTTIPDVLATLPPHTLQSQISSPVNAHDNCTIHGEDNTMRKANQMTNSPKTPVYKNEAQDSEMRDPSLLSAPEIQSNARPKGSRKSNEFGSRPDREIYKPPARQVRQPIRYPEQETYNAVTNVKGQGNANTKNINCTFNIGKGPPSGNAATPKKQKWYKRKKNKTR